MKKVAFEKLKPVSFTLEGVQHTMSAIEFARICACAVQGSKASVKEKIFLARLSDDEKEAIKVIGLMSQDYAQNKNQVKITPIPKTREQLDEDSRYHSFMQPFEESGKGSIGRRMFAGLAKTEEEALQQMEAEKAEARRKKDEKENLKKISILKYDYKPITVETDLAKKVPVPLGEYIGMCPCNVRVPTLPEIQEWNNRIPAVRPNLLPAISNVGREP